MSQADTPGTHVGKSAADLIAQGRKKYALAQARLHQRQGELALLSIAGCLEDVLRAHLLLYNNPAANADWATMLLTLHSQSEPALSLDEAERLHHIQHLRLCLTRGEPVTLTDETLLAYQQFAAALLVRYGVVVVAPETPWHSVPFEYRPGSHRTSKHARLRRSFGRLLPVMLIILVFLIGAGATLALQQVRAIPQAGFHFRPTSVATREETAGNSALVAGQTVYVRGDVAGGLPLRDQPGTDTSVPIHIYLSIGTAVEVVEGPVVTDGTVWWKVSAANQEGWCAEEYLAIR